MPTETEQAEPPNNDLQLLYRDEQLAVVNKPAGLLAHRSRLAADAVEFLDDRLRRQLGCRVHLVHRLDRATSGVLLLAFDPVTAAALGEQFMDRRVEKTYLAVVRGHLDDSGEIDHPLDAPGKPEPKVATTRWRRLAGIELPLALGRYDSVRYSLLEMQPLTGRYRQLRRHLKHISHHLVGDTSHGEGRHNRLFRVEFGVHRMLLHAWRLRFGHPTGGHMVEVSAPLDEPWQRLLQRFGWLAALHEAEAHAGRYNHAP